MSHSVFSSARSLLCALAAGASMAAFGGQDAEALMPTEEFFTETAKVSDGELDTVRGKFIKAGALEISFGLTVGTFINGAIVQDFRLDAEAVRGGIQPENLVRQIQIGPDNSSINPASFSEVPGLISVVQNSLDNQLIQQLNLLDAQVGGFGGFKAEQATQLFNLSQIQATQL